jgi:NIMA (never in mitosis gene a)-related kinase
MSILQGKRMPEKIILNFFAQICLGLEHIHKGGMVHANLQAEHVYLTNGNVKLDFARNPACMANS